LHGGIHHFHAANAFQLIAKMNRYTDTEAEQVDSASRETTPWRLFAFPAIMFGRSYFVAAGWKDGWGGLFWAWLMCFYRAALETKRLHLQSVRQAPAKFGDDAYRDQATRISLEYFSDDEDSKPIGASANND
jgi:hypothetical protein